MRKRSVERPAVVRVLNDDDKADIAKLRARGEQIGHIAEAYGLSVIDLAEQLGLANTAGAIRRER